MEKKKLDWIISIIREEMMTTASTTGKAGFGGSAQGFDPGPTAGLDKKIGKKIDLRRYKPNYRKWVKSA